MLLVSGCSSSGTPKDETDRIVENPKENIVPEETQQALASIGFAAEDVDVDGVTFTLRTIKAISVDKGVVSLVDADITGRLDETDAGPVATVTIGDQEYILPYLENNGVFSNDTVQLSLDDLPALSVGFLTTIEDGFDTEDLSTASLSISQFVVGFDTDPAEIAGRTGSMTYNGGVSTVLIQQDETAVNGFGTGFAQGELTLVVNFDGDTRVSGGFNLSSDLAEEEFTDGPGLILLPDAAFELEDVVIAGNGFTGDITLADDGSDLGVGVTLRDATYQGQFYGVDGVTVGGIIAGTIDVEGEEPIVTTGVFAGEEFIPDL